MFCIMSLRDSYRCILSYSVCSLLQYVIWSLVRAEFDRRKRFSPRSSPLVVSKFLPHQTGWLQRSPGESALVTPKTQAMTHTYDHLPQVHPLLSKSIDFCLELVSLSLCTVCSSSGCYSFISLCILWQY